MTANEEIRDKTIAHMVMLNRYNNGTVKEIMKLLSTVEKDLIKELKAVIEEWTGTAYSIKRIDRMLESVKAINNEMFVELDKKLQFELPQLAEHEQQWQQKTITESSLVVLDLVAVAPVTLVAAIESKPFEGKLLKEWIDKLNQDSYLAIQSAVRMGLVEGQTYKQITDRIVGTKPLQYTDGIMQLNRNKTQALVSTAVAHTTNAARDEFYKSNNDVIKALQWLSTLDGRTTMICKSRDGKIYPIGEGQRPPAHFRCRSVMIPVLKSWKELGLKERDLPAGSRASMNGQVADTETYQTWLEKQPRSFQDETLGKARAELFRSGTPLDRFVDDSGHSYTLDELKKKEN